MSSILLSASWSTCELSQLSEHLQDYIHIHINKWHTDICIYRLYIWVYIHVYTCTYTRACTYTHIPLYQCLSKIVDGSHETNVKMNVINCAITWGFTLESSTALPQVINYLETTFCRLWNFTWLRVTKKVTTGVPGFKWSSVITNPEFQSIVTDCRLILVIDSI